MRLTVTILVALSFFTSALAQRAMNEVFHRDKTFRKIKYLIRDGEKAEMVKADLIIRFEYLKIRTDQGEPIEDFHYSHISSADYNYSERPRWKTPTLFKKGKDHWYTIRAGRESAILQLDKSNYRLVVDAVQRKLKSRKGYEPPSARADAMRYEPAGPSQPDSPPRHVYISVKDPSQPSSAEPVEIKVGMTLAEVEAALGRPSRIARLEDKVVVYRYEDTVVEFKNDKVFHVRFE